MMKKLLLIDDDEKLAKPLKEYFKQYDFELISEIYPLKALDYLKTHTVDLIILDVMLPDIDGFETCRRLRHFSDIPVIMLTARGDVMDRIVGLEVGADDYLAKPFEPRELVARIQNILRRSKSQTIQSKDLSFQGLTINQDQQKVYVQDQLIELTSAEFRLLVLLASQPNRIFNRDDIMLEINGIDADVFSRAIDVLISRLRNKLEPLEVIKTIRSRGYQFVLPSSQQSSHI